MRRHAPPHKKKDTMVHQMTRQKGSLATGCVCTHHLNTVNNTYSLACERDTPTPFSNKIIVFQHKSTIMPFINLWITTQKNMCEGAQMPLDACLDFCLF